MSVAEEQRVVNGQAQGWRVKDEEDGKYRWNAYGPGGMQEGSADTQEEAIAAAREAMRHLGLIER